MHLSRFARTSLGHFPTPLEPMVNLQKTLGGPTLWIKRDDCSGLSTGGNKTRKLEFLMADAQKNNADTIITQGATQSNHARQTAAAAAKLKFGCHILLEDRTGRVDSLYNYNGNVLLDQLHGATVELRPGGTDMAAEMERLAERLRDQGRRPYIVPGGGSNAIGALGYVNAALETLQQANQRGLTIDCIVHATGSAGTQAGLVTGLAACHAGIPVLGIGVRAPREIQEQNVFTLAQRTAEHLGVPDLIGRQNVQANCEYIGEGYGIPAPGTLEAIRLLAREEGVLLDPVYSGKGMAGLIDLIRNGHFKASDNIIFLHTGGSAALFGYADDFEMLDYQATY